MTHSRHALDEARTMLGRERTGAFEDRALVTRIGPIAFRMIRRGQLGERSPLPRDKDQQQMYAVLPAAGLLVERDGIVYFGHRIVQEYFAAAALVAGVVRKAPATLLADERWAAPATSPPCRGCCGR